MAYFRLRTPYFQFIPQNLQYVYRSVCRNRCIYSQGQRSVNLLFGAQKIVHYWIKIFSAKRNMINVLLYNIGSFSKKGHYFGKRAGTRCSPSLLQRKAGVAVAPPRSHAPQSLAIMRISAAETIVATHWLKHGPIYTKNAIKKTVGRQRSNSFPSGFL